MSTLTLKVTGYCQGTVSVFGDPTGENAEECKNPIYDNDYLCSSCRESESA